MGLGTATSSPADDGQAAIGSARGSRQADQSPQRHARELPPQRALGCEGTAAARYIAWPGVREVAKGCRLGAYTVHQTAPAGYHGEADRKLTRRSDRFTIRRDAVGIAKHGLRWVERVA
jgi:hypothetical protein